MPFSSEICAFATLYSMVIFTEIISGAYGRAEAKRCLKFSLISEKFKIKSNVYFPIIFLNSFHVDSKIIVKEIWGNQYCKSP